MKSLAWVKSEEQFLRKKSCEPNFERSNHEFAMTVDRKKKGYLSEQLRKPFVPSPGLEHIYSTLCSWVI